MSETKSRTPFRKAKRWLLVLGGACLVVASGFQLTRHLFESPTYVVIAADGNREIRKYESRLVAQTVVEATDRSAATNEGFSRLAGYIFGANAKANGANEKISMTTPVEATPSGFARDGERIAMTTPVEVTPSSFARDGERIAMTTPVEVTPSRFARDGERIAMTTPVEATDGEANTWTITFTMPTELSEGEVPRPKDQRVVLRTLEPETVAALRFGGRVQPKRVNEQRARLVAWVTQQGYEPVGPVSVAVYDPPHWVLPPFRRNEVSVRIRRPVAPSSWHRAGDSVTANSSSSR